MPKSLDTKRTILRKKPQQERSIQRLDTILEAAAVMIVEQGVINMKMTDLAARAKVPIGSLYQFFPEKAAVVRALFDRRTSISKIRVNEMFSNISSLEDMLEVALSSVDWYYEQYRQDPLWMALWAASMMDRDLMELHRDHNVDIARIFREAVEHLLPEDVARRMEARSILFTHLGGAALRLAVTQDEQMARRILDEWKTVIREQLFR
ncbi:TetR/AcrR family transcriptional regulator [Agrobacterium sp. a22-2]|uniref:TetR/AcrR family transcriptional regulator n=1 Tax=Agrobacterium sp. a22-2 TaxID=2283840 RepID=UPI001447ACE2|nr:TetR/AcrR family transcriptional regulator [Agrobacterium sp. a22-2]NKN38618.1 TetR/AcrR family transcriptional regulator [Agrobacterium sp. a22-2]